MTGVQTCALPISEDEKKPNPGVGIWMLLAVGFGVLASLLVVLYLHPFRQNPAPAPIPVPAPAVEAAQTVAPPEQAGKSDHSDWSTIQAQPAGSETPGQGANAARTAKLVPSDMMDAQLNAPTVIAGDFKKPASPEEAPPPAINASEMGNGGNVSGAVFNGASQVKVQPAGSAISAGVAEGLLTHRTPVIYPLIAKEAHVSGTVVVGAAITKNGTIAGLHVISGPTMLRNAAVDSVKTWRYRPYMLDGKPVDVDTTISVVFSLGSQ